MDTDNEDKRKLLFCLILVQGPVWAASPNYNTQTRDPSVKINWLKFQRTLNQFKVSQMTKVS